MKNEHAFSLLELIIALSIIVLLVTIAYPAYTHHVAAVHRKMATITLLEIASQLEQPEETQENNTAHHVDYQVAWNRIDVPTSPGYEFSLKSADPQHFRLLAIPVGAQAKRDHQCGILSIDETGLKISSGTRTMSECWQ